MRSRLRWACRRALNALPPRAWWRPAPGIRRIAYLFAGTYGDFVQILDALKDVHSAWPGAELFLLAPKRQFRDFRAELPPGVKRVGYGRAAGWAFRPVDLLLTNAVGVYRVRFELAARFCARNACGFRYPEEARRTSYGLTLALPRGRADFAEENRRLVGEAAAAPRRREVAAGDVDWRAARRGPVLFHVGSAGVKKALGLRAYTDLLCEAAGCFPLEATEFVYGPGDQDVAALLRERLPAARLRRLAMPEIADRVREFGGFILCINSFMAHLCRYLGRPAVVLHRSAVPYGYDCSPLHVQVVLAERDSWSLAGLREIIATAPGGP